MLRREEHVAFTLQREELAEHQPDNGAKANFKPVRESRGIDTSVTI